MTKDLKKAAYSAPRLVEFGTVRNLTGGSATMRMDGTTLMVRDNLP